MKTTIDLSAAIHKTARTVQVAGLFDVPIEQKQTLHWEHDLPLEDHAWNVGLIVGPSGAGKSVLASNLWPERVREHWDWPQDRAVIDGFDKGVSIKDVTGALVSVGFGTVPAWLRPYRTLSNGEQFRANMARAIIEDADPIVVDEFTSVVDRQVAKVASHAVQKTIRRDGRQFVAVTCHYDVEDWLQPDWIYDVAAGSFTWRSVQPHPPLQLEIRPCTRAAWGLFARHHYLSAQLSSAAKCFIAHIDSRPVAFSAYTHFMHPHTKTIKIGHRLVVLPDYQGLGIARIFDEWLGQYLYAQGYRYRNVIAHPGMIRMYENSPRWRDTTIQQRMTSTGMTDSKAIARLGRTQRPTAAGRGPQTSVAALNKKAQLSTRRLAVRSFEYQPPEETA